MLEECEVRHVDYGDLAVFLCAVVPGLTAECADNIVRDRAPLVDSRYRTNLGIIIDMVHTANGGCDD